MRRRRRGCYFSQVTVAGVDCRKTNPSPSPSPSPSLNPGPTPPGVQQLSREFGEGRWGACAARIDDILEALTPPPYPQPIIAPPEPSFPDPVDPGPRPAAWRSPGAGGADVAAATRERPLDARARLQPVAVTRKLDSAARTSIAKLLLLGGGSSRRQRAPSSSLSAVGAST